MTEVEYRFDGWSSYDRAVADGQAKLAKDNLSSTKPPYIKYLFDDMVKTTMVKFEVRSGPRTVKLRIRRK